MVRRSPPPRGGFVPDRGAPVVWPDDFGTRFCLFVDTEEEFDWSKPFDRTARSTEATAALPEADLRLRDLGAAPSYLVDYAIATDPRAIDALRAAQAQGATIGTQLHPWINPPHDEAVSRFNSFPGNLTPDLEAAKLARLTEAITHVFAEPRSYRAGRYGIGPATLATLARHGYRIDSSMRARYDYRAQGGPDFAAIGNRAFRAGAGMVELPLTSLFTGSLKAFGPSGYRWLERVPHGPGIASRLRLIERIALTPEDMPIDRVLDAIRTGADTGVRLFNLSFHSPSLVPGHTPYVRDTADRARFWQWWDRVAGLFAKLGIEAASEDALLAAIDRAI